MWPAVCDHPETVNDYGPRRGCLMGWRAPEYPDYGNLFIFVSENFGNSNGDSLKMCRRAAFLAREYVNLLKQRGYGIRCSLQERRVLKKLVLWQYKKH